MAPSAVPFGNADAAVDCFRGFGARWETININADVSLATVGNSTNGAAFTNSESAQSIFWSRSLAATVSQKRSHSGVDLRGITTAKHSDTRFTMRVAGASSSSVSDMVLARLPITLDRCVHAHERSSARTAAAGRGPALTASVCRHPRGGADVTRGRPAPRCGPAERQHRPMVGHTLSYHAQIYHKVNPVLVRSLSLAARMTSKASPSAAPRRLLAANVRRLRLARSLTVKQAASRVGMHWRQWQKIEAGHSNPTVATIVRVADALDVTPAELFAPLSTGALRPT